MPSAAARRARSAGASPRRKRGRGAAKRRRSQPLEQRILITATLCLLAFGAVMVYSASSATSLLQSGGTGSGYLIRFLVLRRDRPRRDARARARRRRESRSSITPPLLAVSFVLVLAVHVPHVGVSVNGARRWLGAGPLQFQPSELMKLALVLYGATLLARRPQRVHDLRDLLQPLLFVVAAAMPARRHAAGPRHGDGDRVHDDGAARRGRDPAAQPRDRARLRVRRWSCCYALVKPYARARLTSFLDPWAHASTSGFQAVQGQIAIGSGGLFGVGPGQSVQKIFYLPEAPTDFILAVDRRGARRVGVCALLFLYGLIAYAGLRAAKGARSLHSALIAVGVTSLIVSQALLNVFAVLGLAPLTGVPLPFVSYGSSSLIVMLAAMGLLLNVASGGTAHVRAVPSRSRRSSDARPREAAGLGGESSEADRDRGRRDGGARRAGARGGRRAAG